MTSPEAGDRYAAERWFLAQGLPAVVRRGALLRRVWIRSAPAIAGYAVVAANSIVVVTLSGKHTIDIGGRPDLAEGAVLALLVLVLPVAAVVGWLVSRIGSLRWRLVAVAGSIVVIVLGAVFGGLSYRVFANLMLSGIAVALTLVLTATGVGSVLGWAAHATLTNLALIAGMFVRALPVVLLTFLVFFNTYVWLMAAVITRTRLWLGLGFLFLIAAAFLVSSTLDRVRPILASPEPDPGDAAQLAGTPFEHMPDDPGSTPLSHPERANVVFVVAASQVGQVLTVAALTGGIFGILGLILVSPPLLDSWTRGAGRPDGHLLGMTLPVPDALIQTTMVLTAITFMYLSAKAVTDTEYRAKFVEPMLDEVRLTLVARDRYRSALARR